MKKYQTASHGAIYARVSPPAPRRRAAPAPPRAAGNPGSFRDEDAFDALELTPELYEELGIDPEELEDQLAFRATDLDPEGVDLGPDGPGDGVGVPPHAAIVAAVGLRPGEAAHMRERLDRAGLAHVTLVPIGPDALAVPTREALARLGEPDWAAPAPAESPPHPGAPRAVLIR